MFDLKSSDNFPLQNFHEHRTEVSGIDWNLISKKLFLSCSHSGLIKLWDPFFGQPISTATFQEHIGSTYSVKWNPHYDKTFLSCGGDGSVKVWDVNK